MHEAMPFEASSPSVIEEGLILCKKIVNALISRLGIPFQVRDDLFGAAQLGLAQALKRFDPSRNNDFLAFAALRIRGSCIDYLRRCSGLSSKAYKILKSLKIHQEYEENNEAANSEELIFTGALIFKLAESEDKLAKVPSSLSDPEENVIQTEQISLLKEIVATLPHPFREFYQACYVENVSFVDYARKKKVSKATISKLNSRFLRFIKTKLYEMGYFN
ncbi:MAG: sigma-70 family RNA polymerase sigma factor [Deltaproteobacteria bacterium]|nr:sigma-70 family RNA polymerase sigma factor [Deltaproteobacteria bacterium]MCX7952766.1 sigma-70 family RNA polymerase sigma factor [Deltaproteobacteria bacterium]